MLMAVISLFLSAALVAFLFYLTYKVLDWYTLRMRLQWAYQAAQLFFTTFPLCLTLPMVIAGAATLYFLLTYQTTRRMGNLQSAVLDIHHGKYQPVLPNENLDALGELEQSVNALAVRIDETLAQQKATEQAKDDFIVNIAHDLRTPLTSVLGYLSFISEKDLDPELSAKYAAISYDKAKQLEALIEALFDTAHLTMDDLQINREQLDLEQLLLQKREELYPQLHDAEMTVRMKIEAPTINADGALMARVFDNLFNNAIRYTREGRSIDIIGVPIPDGVRITLATHANPIPAEDLERVFDKLYRLDKSRGSGDRGTGLGLPISRKIIELHGGQLTARQTSDGTAFDIYLPN